MANNDQSRGPEPARKDNPANEESARVIAELQARIGELHKTNADLKILLHSTEPKRTQAAREALRSSEIKSRALLEGSPVCNKIIDLNSRLQYMSAAGVKALKIPDINALYGCTYPPDFYAESMRAPLVEHLDRAKAGEITSVECPLFDMDGNTIWYHTTFVPARDDEGRIEYIIAASVDITERKQTEADKMAMERQLLDARKFESLGVMAGAIAHEFNNILKGITGYADVALDNLPAMSPVRGHVQEIGKASKRAAELADQMLAYSGKGRIVSEPIDVGELIKEMVHLFEASISENAVLNFIFADNLPTFDGDTTQIRQIVTNLIINASEAIGADRGVIRLSTGIVKVDHTCLTRTGDMPRTPLGEPLPDGLYVYFEVSDTGCGMDDETVEKIYDPFFTSKFPGRGLGMSVVLGIVRSHGGAIEIRSEVGSGTTFKVLFSATGAADNRVAAPAKSQVETGDFR